MDKKFIIQMSILTILTAFMLTTCIVSLVHAFKWVWLPGIVTMGTSLKVAWDYANKFVDEWEQRKKAEETEPLCYLNRRDKRTKSCFTEDQV